MAFTNVLLASYAFLSPLLVSLYLIPFWSGTVKFHGIMALARKDLVGGAPLEEHRRRF